MRKTGYYWVIENKDDQPEIFYYREDTMKFYYDGEQCGDENDLYMVFNERLISPLEDTKSLNKNISAGTIVELEMPKPNIWNIDSSSLKDIDKIEIMDNVIAAMKEKLKSKLKK